MNLIRESFMDESITEIEKATYLVVAVKLPTGAIELITNTTNLVNKADYYVTAYDDDFRLKNNKDIQIVGYMIA